MIRDVSIVKGLIPRESVIINKIQPLGSSHSISYTRVNIKKYCSKVINGEQFHNLEVLMEEGKFNFKGDPELGPLNENSPIYRAVKESATQLGLDIEVEE